MAAAPVVGEVFIPASRPPCLNMKTIRKTRHVRWTPVMSRRSRCLAVGRAPDGETIWEVASRMQDRRFPTEWRRRSKPNAFRLIGFGKPILLGDLIYTELIRDDEGVER
jgi:hypothetical protein